MVDTNKDKCCTCTTPEITIELNKQGPQGLTGPKGDDGFSPIIDVLEDTYDKYTLQITDAEKTFETPNLKAVIPAGGSNGQVLTKVGGDNGSVSWKDLPLANQDTKGILKIASPSDLIHNSEEESYPEGYYLGAITPEVFNETIASTLGDKYVTLDTTQTITGNKKFDGTIVSFTADVLTNKILNYDNGGEIIRYRKNSDSSQRWITIGSYGVTQYILANNELRVLVGDNEYKVLNQTNVKGSDTINVVQTTDGIALNVNSVGVDYELIKNLPTINGETLIGHMTSKELHIPSQDDIDNLTQLVQQLQARVEALEANIDGGNA